MRDFCFLYGSASPASLGFGGRASVQPGKGAIFAGLYRFNPDESGRGRQPRAVCVRAVETCSDSGAHWKRDNVQGIGMMFHLKQSRFRTIAPTVPLFFVILRSLRRRISARGGWVGLEAGRFFADSTTALVRTTVSVRQNDKVRAERDVQRSKFRKNVSRETSENGSTSH